VERKYVAVVDDNVGFAKQLVSLLQDAGYRAEALSTIKGALELLRSDDPPDFLLLHRRIRGHMVEVDDLPNLSHVAARAAKRCYILVFTVKADLTLAMERTIQSLGAIRVLHKQAAALMFKRIDDLKDELDELSDLTTELQAAAQERSKLTTTLVGTGIGMTVIDRHYHCWFANEDQEDLVGAHCTGGLCFEKFHGHMPACGPCWGCTIRELFDRQPQKGEKPVQRIFFSRFKGGQHWVFVMSKPIRSQSTHKVIAAREAVIDAK